MFNETIEPLGDWVVIKPIPMTQTRGGIALAEGAEVDIPRGEVMLVGPGRITEDGTMIEMTVKPGDLVMLNFQLQYEPLTVKLGDKNHILVRQREIVALVRNS